MNSKEMADEVFRIRDTYLERRKKKITIAKRTAAVLFPCVTVLAAVVFIVDNGKSIAARDELPNSSAVTVSAADKVKMSISSAASAESVSTSETSAVTTTMKVYETEMLPESIVPEEIPVTEIRDGTAEAVPTETEPSSVPAPPENEPDMTAASVDQTIDEEPTEAVPETDEEADTEYAPDETETDGLTAFSEEEIDALFPVIDLDRRYVCEGRTVPREMLDGILSETVLYSGVVSAEVTVYSLVGSTENIQIAVSFNGGEPILYGTKDEIQ